MNNQFFLIIFIAWNLILSLSFIYFFLSWRKIFQGTSGKTVKKVLEENLLRFNRLNNKVVELQKDIDLLNQEKVSFFQKTAFLRFNPFGDTGGNQSFIWVCLDQENNGIVITSLYGREGTRVYGKRIKKGKEIDHRLSDEERQVLEMAQKGNS